jgi:glycine cleavage system H lipoate-binding protein
VSEAPDFIQAAVGYRSWHLSARGELSSLTAAGAWQPGVNRAACHRGLEHQAPAAGCECGLYALHRHRDRQWMPSGVNAIHGAVAAWGDLEVHDTGFRAEFARVVALALPERAKSELRRRAALAAALHEVPVVTPAKLRETSVEHGLELPATVVPAQAPRSKEPLFVHPAHHVWARVEKDGRVRVGVTSVMAEVLTSSPELSWMAPVALHLEQGGELAVASGRIGDVVVRSPVAGVVSELNGVHMYAPHTLRRSPYRTGWVALIEPDDLTRDAPQLISGPSILLDYADRVRDEEDRRRVFGAVLRPRRYGWAA